MTDEDDDFWITYIASTPEEDADFAGCVKPIGCLVAVALIAGLLIWTAG